MSVEMSVSGQELYYNDCSLHFPIDRSTGFHNYLAGFLAFHHTMYFTCYVIGFWSSCYEISSFIIILFFLAGFLAFHHTMYLTCYVNRFWSSCYQISSFIIIHFLTLHKIFVMSYTNIIN